MTIPIVQVNVGKEEKDAVMRVLESGQLTQGHVVKEFENAFAEYLGVKHAIATSSGTSALHTALVANGVGSGDEVITTPFTFIATANSIRMADAKPVFVDVEEDTGNIDTNLIEAAITNNTKAIMPVHLYGRPARMDSIMKIAERYGLVVIEDACQAHGAEFNGRKTGSFGSGCFSFYATKNMMIGEGGMVTTQNDNVAAIARQFIQHGSSERYYHDIMGYNYRMTNVEAAIGLVQLKKLDQLNGLRAKNARYLTECLCDLDGIVIPEVCNGHVFHQYTIRVTGKCGRSRDEIKDSLLKMGVSSAIFYPVPIHKQKCYLEYNSQIMPVSEMLSKEVLSLPVHPSLTKDELDGIVRYMKDICCEKRQSI